jgi:GntR family transcriptional regulator
MLFLLDSQSGVPYYRQIMDQVKLHVVTGVLVEGDELPSIRSLAVTLGVNPMTVSKAYAFLENEQVLDRRPGRPLVVRAHTNTQLKQRRQDRLRSALDETVILVRNLAIPTEQALIVFREALDARPSDATDQEDN